MRTTIDLPDDLYRTLKARAALKGITLRALIQGMLERGLSLEHQAPGDRDPPPVIVPPRGVILPAVPLREVQEDEDVAKHVRSSRR